MTSHCELATWVAAVADHRDREAFTRLFDHFAPRLHAYLLRLGTEAAAAEEITQDAMIALWRKASLFDEAKSSVATWLYRVARNRRIDLMRRNRLDLLDGQDPALEIIVGLDLDHYVEIQQREEAIRTAMDRLPLEQLSLVRLAFFDELSHSEISERTGLPLGTVKSRIRLAFTRLRRALEADGVVEAW